MEYMHQKNYVTLEKFNEESFTEISEKVLENREQLREELTSALAPIRQKAKENAYLALELLEN